MTMRGIGGVVVGFVVWWVLFYLVSFLIVILWPGSETLRQALFQEGDFSVIPTAMYVAFLLMYVAIGLLTGWLIAWIGRNKLLCWVVAVPLFLYADYQHLFVLWEEFPGWYNLGVVLLIWPFIVLGGRLKSTPDNISGNQAGLTQNNGEK